jgi:hypothetical protein
MTIILVILSIAALIGGYILTQKLSNHYTNPIPMIIGGVIFLIGITIAIYRAMTC